MKNIAKQLIFKEDKRNQDLLFPPNLSDLIPENDLVRTVDNVIDKINTNFLLESYKPGGTSIYHPKMMLKVIIYAYTQKVYSSREIAKALRQNINFMWLSGMQTPDFRTLNYFRGKRLKSEIERIFTEFTTFLYEHGQVSLVHQFLDGTKIEANANKYTFVWKKSTQTHKSNLEKKIKEHLREINEELEEEKLQHGDKDLAELEVDIDLTSDKLEGFSKNISEILDSPTCIKTIKKFKKKLDGDFIPRMNKYEKYIKILGERNSFSKTDHDATFMRMKEDAMRNGQTKAGYNVQIGTEKQFILSYLIGQKPSDSNLLGSYIEKIKVLNRIKPQKLVADAGYGSEENYDYLENENIEAYVKYNYFDRENRPRYKPDNYRAEGMEYDEYSDEYKCPNNQTLTYLYTSNQKSWNGYRQKVRIYGAENCQACNLKELCTKSKNNKKIWVNENLEWHKTKVKEKLLSEEGERLRKERNVDVEGVFGQIKQNMGIRRFMLRSLEKVNVEFGIIALAHNFRKLALKVA